MKRVLTLFVIFVMMMSLVSCGSSYKDGTYKGENIEDEHGSLMEVEITIKDNVIVACSMVAKDSEGNVKDENYGKDAGDIMYKKAQRAVEGMAQYPALLIEAGNVEDVDAVAGATVSAKQFKLAVEDALKKAE